MRMKLLLVPLLACSCLLSIGCGGQESTLVVPGAPTLEEDQKMLEQQEKQAAQYMESLKNE
ncbi:hypothetical protein Pla100_45260 [Neorhodopirellula pilleata]|uniref:Secreted protein n=2 Tax=Neorhodopirellula pilleata TaxID=2714738 RepID=A0A5C5ZZZ0_9BACT|nr:hypothetical protein Pla100_45260 [Neorhodopirellula pilleata]